MQVYLTEALGTFFLVLIIGLTGDPIAIGLGLAVLVYMGGHISGAHYNPAVTLGLLAHKAISGKEAGMYIIAQLVGAILASLVCFFLLGKPFVPTPSLAFSSMQMLLVEILFTFLLMLVIFNVAVSKRTDGNGFYGIAIGLVILAGAYAGGPISGGAFNPVVGLGPVLVDSLVGESVGWPYVWLYLVGPIVGSLLAVPVFALQEGRDA